MDGSPVTESVMEPLLSSCEERINGESSSYSFALIREEIKKLLGIALPMIVMNMLQGSLQLVSMMIVGHIDELSLSSVSMATSFANVTGFSFLSLRHPLLQSAASTRVANELGAGNTPGAILAARSVMCISATAARSVMCISATEVLIMGITLFSLRDVRGHVFSNDFDVIQYMATIMPILALTSMLEGLQGVL